jgi:hypothetical protein
LGSCSLHRCGNKRAARRRAKLASDCGKRASTAVDSYSSFENAGIPAHVSGGGGGRPERADHIGRHFMTIDVDAAHGVLGARVVPVDHGEAIDEDD